MELSLIDPVFGEMTYKHRWQKQMSLALFGQKWQITLAVKAYNGKPITDAQRNSFQDVRNNLGEYCKVITDCVFDFINDYCGELAETWIEARMLHSPEELAQIVVPKTLLIKQDGEVLLLLDCPWDEHGLAVRLHPDVSIGSQDLFL